MGIRSSRARHDAPTPARHVLRWLAPTVGSAPVEIPPNREHADDREYGHGPDGQQDGAPKIDDVHIAAVQMDRREDHRPRKRFRLRR